MGQNTEITMIVNTEGINPNNVDSHVEFKDNRKNQTPSKDPENFTSLINQKFDVFWIAVAQDGSGDTIQITQIGQKPVKGGADLLKESPHPNGENGEFKAKVKDHYIEGQESYYIKFKINNSGPEYEVDPKLEMPISI